MQLLLLPHPHGVHQEPRCVQVPLRPVSSYQVFTWIKTQRPKAYAPTHSSQPRCNGTQQTRQVQHSTWILTLHLPQSECWEKINCKVIPAQV